MASLNHNDVAPGYPRHSKSEPVSGPAWPLQWHLALSDNLFPDLNTPDLGLTGLGDLNLAAGNNNLL